MIDTPTKSRLRRFFDRWEDLVDRWAISPWSSAYVWAYGAVWLIVERFNIGWDGWATLAGIEIALSIRRYQRRHDPG